MPKLLEPDVAHRLLVTAARRQHVAAVHKMVSHQRLGYIKQHVDAATLEVMLFDLRRHAMSGAYRNLLTQLPAAAHLSTEAFIKVLLDAAAVHASKTIFVVCRKPAVQQLDTAAGLHLLQAAVKLGHIPRWFCDLPAAQQLSSGEVLQLLQAAVLRGVDTAELCRLPGTQELDSQSVLRLLQAAVLRGNMVHELCDIPGAQQLDSQGVLQVLKWAVQQGNA
jgi:hypothetical protein